MSTRIHRVLLTAKKTYFIFHVLGRSIKLCVWMPWCEFRTVSVNVPPKLNNLLPPTPYRPQTVGGKSKIRYVGGMCVGKIPPVPYKALLRQISIMGRKKSHCQSTSWSHLPITLYSSKSHFWPRFTEWNHSQKDTIWSPHNYWWCLIFHVCEIWWNFVSLPVYLQSMWVRAQFLLQGFVQDSDRTVCMWTPLYSIWLFPFHI